jgi:hypothetical protein
VSKPPKGIKDLLRVRISVLSKIDRYLVLDSQGLVYWSDGFEADWFDVLDVDFLLVE